MSRTASPFSPRTLLAVVAVGAGAFLLLLYAIGAGWDGSNDRNVGAHAAANGLNGFAGLVRLLEDQGHEVSLSRSEARLDDEGLLVLTPQHAADGDAIAEIIEARRYVGPTLLILPKWLALPAEQFSTEETRPGWVVFGGAIAPGWLEPSSTAREIAALPALSQAARGAFATIAERVERSLFALRSLSADDWHAARAAYAEFALAAPQTARGLA